ncbi:DNA alkylation repair protein [Streptococcus cuniculi]|uniref:DNA alkylation repair protein n=1 Tax=Streptococcus cuniculi TaxID=1432788 RepID=A0A4Y9JC80_9STRE|nr:DNA alkylation repair protein [Streptococcus cuniculi]MBF0778644.1 DNA alkylation repair protein [Streptococcus cuniculi]TFU97425.1 DNA alkylation repair protein [Streptococcus cuniculi]
MTNINPILKELESASHAGTLKRYAKIQETQPYYGVPMGAISRLAKPYTNQLDLLLPLWETRILEAQYLAIQIAKAKPNQLPETSIRACLDDTVSQNVLDKFTSLILSKRSDTRKWEEELLQAESPVFQRLGWALRGKYFAKKQASPEEIEATLSTIETHLQTVAEPIQWTMNQCLVEIAVAYPDYLEQGLDIGRTLAVYADLKVPKGCTSAYAPDWIEALLKRKK